MESQISGEEPRPYKLVKSVYQSCMDTQTIESRGVQPLLNVLKAMGGWPLLEGPAWSETDFKWFSLVWRFRQLGYSVDYLLGERGKLSGDESDLSLQISP